MLGYSRAAGWRARGIYPSAAPAMPERPACSRDRQPGALSSILLHQQYNQRDPHPHVYSRHQFQYYSTRTSTNAFYGLRQPISFNRFYRAKCPALLTRPPPYATNRTINFMVMSVYNCCELKRVVKNDRSKTSCRKLPVSRGALPAWATRVETPMHHAIGLRIRTRARRGVGVTIL